MLAAASHDCHPAMSEVTPAVFDDAGFLLEDPTMIHIHSFDQSENHRDGDRLILQ
jgi:hypothetical protein